MHRVPPDLAGEPPDAAIEGSEVVYRRLSDGSPNMIAIDQVTGVRRPSSGAFKPDDDGISVFRRSVLEAAGLGPQDIRTAPLNLVASVVVEDLRSIDLDVEADPWPTDIEDREHPRNGAHALIVGMQNLSRGERRRRQKALVALPSMTLVVG